MFQEELIFGVLWSVLQLPDEVEEFVAFRFPQMIGSRRYGIKVLCPELSQHRVGLGVLGVK